MALFPRQIGGKYVMLSRKDRENLHLSRSDDVNHWNEVTELFRPSTRGAASDRQLWSPIGPSGLARAHARVGRCGVRARRALRDLEDPQRVRLLAEALLEPDESAREGTFRRGLPRAARSCTPGAIMPLGFPTPGSRCAQMPLSELIEALLSSQAPKSSRRRSLSPPGPAPSAAHGQVFPPPATEGARAR